MISKFIRIQLQFFRLDLKNTYFRSYFFLYEILSVYLTVLVYFYSSKAFVPDLNLKMDFYQGNFFYYLFWGDFLLRIPQSLFSHPARNLRLAIQDNTFDSMVLMSGSPKLILFSLATMSFLREIISMGLLLFCAALFFELKFDFLYLAQAVLIFFAFLPFFLGVGFILAGVVLFFERGETALASLSTIMAIMAGMYFPIEVFPGFIQRLCNLFSPYGYFLRSSRLALSGRFDDWSMLVVSFIVGVCFFWVALDFVDRVLNHKKKKGESLIIN